MISDIEAFALIHNYLDQNFPKYLAAVLFCTVLNGSPYIQLINAELSYWDEGKDWSKFPGFLPAYSWEALWKPVAAKSFQSCLTLCDPIDGLPPGSPIPGILQARTLEWVAISFSNAWQWKVEVRSLSRVWLLATPWTVAYQSPPSMGFSRQECWSGVPLPSLLWKPKTIET